MTTLLAQLAEGTEAPRLCRGAILDVVDSSFVVCLDGLDGETVMCELLTTDDRIPISLLRGDSVLTWISPQDPRGVILGRIGAPAAPAEPEPSGPPDELVIEARQSLTLRVGDGSITIREDGRILIKGRELVSHAKGMNRILGGSVAIN
jgi:hypothetical protein